MAWAGFAVAALRVGESGLARQALAAARATLPAAPAMARSHIGAIEALLRLPNDRALSVGMTHLATYPSDVFVLAMTMNALHISGRTSRRQDALALLDAAGSADHFAVPSMRSVILADLGQLGRARADAELGLAGNARSADAAHGLAHVFYERSDHEVGRDWLSSWTADFDPQNCGVHLSWHLALHDLALGDVDRLLERYDRAILPHSSSSLYVDAVDILWRSRLTGIEDRDRFAALRSIVPVPEKARESSLGLLQACVALAARGTKRPFGQPSLPSRRRTQAVPRKRRCCRWPGRFWPSYWTTSRQRSGILRRSVVAWSRSQPATRKST